MQSSKRSNGVRALIKGSSWENHKINGDGDKTRLAFTDFEIFDKVERPVLWNILVKSSRYRLLGLSSEGIRKIIMYTTTIPVYPIDLDKLLTNSTGVEVFLRS
jgi:hypothetical protein